MNGRLKNKLRKGVRLLVTLYSAAFAVSASTSESSVATDRLRRLPVSIPFELIDNRIFILATINGQGPFHIMFDSGAGGMVRSEVAKRLRLVVVGTVESGGAGEGRVRTGTTKISRISVAGITLRDLEFAAIELPGGHDDPVFGTWAVDGIIGPEFLDRYVVRLDYVTKTLTLIDPHSFVYRGKGQRLSFTRHGIVPLVSCQIDQHAAKLGIDTGARTSLIVNGPFVEKNGLREQYHPKFEGITGWGIGGPIRTQLARVRLLTLGEVDLHDVVARFSLQKSGDLTRPDFDGVIGPDVLKRFTIIFNSARREIIFEKNDLFDIRDQYDKSGMWLGQKGESFEVVDVIKDGPAAVAGIRLGDCIVEVDGLPTSRWLLPDVRVRFRDAADNTPVRLRIRRAGHTEDLVLTLRELV
jgi:hypothetical protein